MQEINLYQPKSKGVRGMLSAGSTATVFGVVGITLLGLWAFASWQINKLDVAAQVVRNQQQAQLTMEAAQGPQLDALSDEELDALIKQLDDSVYRKTCAVNKLADESLRGVPGFSTRLHALAERNIEGVWLERLMLGPEVQYVSVSGSALAPELVPRYLHSLAQDPALKGGKIDEFVIEKPHRQDEDGKTITVNGRLNFTAGHHELKLPRKPEDKSDDKAGEETT